MAKSRNTYALKVSLAAGLYPFLHYYNGNFDMADSWLQFWFLVGICFVLPPILMVLTKFVFKIGVLRPLEKYRLAGVNLVVFFGLLAMLIFLGNKKEIAVVMLGGGLLSFLVYRYLNKIVVLQLVLAALSVVLLVPRLWFMATYSSDWTAISTPLKEVTLQTKPNIYVIQPDGYANFSHLDKPPYDFDNSQFEGWLAQQNFQNYPNFRSNYYSTLSSNSSLFAMKHHFYQNTYTGNLKTYGSQEVVVGPLNNTLNILENNGYTTHFITDNSYFLINGKQSNFDHCNIERQQIKLISQQLVDMQEVSEVYSVAGRYDLVAIVRVKNNQQIADTITVKFGELNGITATETLIAFNTFSRHDLEHMFSIGE